MRKNMSQVKFSIVIPVYRTIPLTGYKGKGKFAIVDNEDYEFLNQFNWYMTDNGYAVYRHLANGTKRTVRMHRLINKTPKGLVTDHINQDKLDNRKSNLRT